MARRQGTGEVTISDVARHAGVSKAQAARAMGGYGSVSSEAKAINNAGEGQVVQVRTPSGIVVSGMARQGGMVEIVI